MAASEIFAAGPSNLRTRRPARTVVGIVLMSLVLTLGVERVVMAAPLSASKPGALLVQAVGGNGRVSPTADLIKVAGAYPGMAAETSTFEVRNTGSLPVTFAVTSGDLVASGPLSLDDVLRIAVRDPATGVLVYRGRLSGLLVEHTGTLAAGTAATFTVDVTWPSTSADNAYQGAGLHFTVLASPSAA